MVASPFWDIPLRLITHLIVLQNIIMSVMKETWFTYQISSSNFFLQLIAFLPFTCAHPVMPGRTSCLLACSSLYRGRYCTNNGRGPIRAISPFNTLKSWGSSSMEVARTIFPMEVIRKSSGNNSPWQFFRSFMVLNLMILNIFPSFPGRS